MMTDWTVVLRTAVILAAATVSTGCLGDGKLGTDTQASDDETSGDETSGDETSGDETSGDAVCYSIVDMRKPVKVIDCDLPQPCAMVQFKDDECSPSFPDYNPADGACIVEQLVAGSQAAHSIRDCPGGQYSHSWDVQVFGDGTVLYVRTSFHDTIVTSRATWRAMPDAAYFQACETDTPEQLIECLQGIRAQECQLGEPSCP
jgi:hypothetical protein